MPPALLPAPPIGTATGLFCASSVWRDWTVRAVVPVSSWVDCVAHDGRYTISARLSDLPAPRPAMVFA
ncbi:MAG: hypothetical protein EBT09_13390, partial [Actinobacteria bacterium]|nr:hypothetical protein [Actinomycetota bacterium]